MNFDSLNATNLTTAYCGFCVGFLLHLVFRYMLESNREE